MLVKTQKHVILDCPLLDRLRDEHSIEDIESGVMNDFFLLEMEKTLEIRWRFGGDTGGRKTKAYEGERSGDGE